MGRPGNHAGSRDPSSRTTLSRTTCTSVIFMRPVWRLASWAGRAGAMANDPRPTTKPLRFIMSTPPISNNDTTLAYKLRSKVLYSSSDNATAARPSADERAGAEAVACGDWRCLPNFGDVIAAEREAAEAFSLVLATSLESHTGNLLE